MLTSDVGRLDDVHQATRHSADVPQRPGRGDAPFVLMTSSVFTQAGQPVAFRGIGNRDNRDDSGVAVGSPGRRKST